jgi:aspartate racemase
MSWESTVPYYRQINETVRERLGGLHSAGSSCTASTSTTSNGCSMPATGRRRELLAGTARAVRPPAHPSRALHQHDAQRGARNRGGGHDTVAPHRRSDGGRDQADRASTVGVLGTRFTMEQAFYRDRLSERHGLRVVVPGPEDRETVHRIIYQELCLGVVTAESRGAYRRILAKLAAQGAQAIILGCTEISLLVTQQDSAVPLFDTTAIHARAAALEALAA